MSLSNTGGHGRGGQSGRIIGDVINHGKHVFWAKPNTHYHQGMAAGENTLNALCARVVMRGITAQGGAYSSPRFLEDYVAFMTTPGHPQRHLRRVVPPRLLQALVGGRGPERCSQGTEGHNTASIGGFVTLPPVLMAGLVPPGADAAAAKATARAHLRLTHDSAKLAAAADVYSDLLAAALAGRDLRGSAKAAAATLGVNVERLLARDADDASVVGSVLGSACYIDSSLPVVIYLAAKYPTSFEDAVLANTNAGGENCHRGAALGAIMGASVGEQVPPPMASYSITIRIFVGHPRPPSSPALAAHRELRAEIDAFTAALFPGDGKAEL
eukprot:jgi/Tetstr1/434135/TSEL_023279.t1